MNNFSSLVTGVGGIVLLIAPMIWPITSRYRAARSNEAYVITGQKGKAVANPETSLVSTDLSGQKVTMGGGVFVTPLIQRLHVLDLSSRRIMVQIRNVVSGQGIKLNLGGVAIVKVGDNEDSIRAAAQRFLMQQEKIETSTQETLAGALRSIVGGLSVKQITRDHTAPAQRVADEPEVPLTGQGLVLDILQIQDITDDGTYLSNLGRSESVKVSQIVVIAEANVRCEAEQARLAVKQEIAISERELALKEAEIKAETDVARAQAAAAGPLAQADCDQAILTEQEKVIVRQVALKDRQLDTEVRKPADAKRYETEAAVQGRRNSGILETETRRAAAIANTEAQVEIACLTGEGKKQRRAMFIEAEVIEGARHGEAEKARRIAEADAVRTEGEAKAAAALAVGTAEAKAMNKRAAAFADYSEAVVLQMPIEVLPQVAGGVTAPMGSIDKPAVVSTGGVAVLPHQVNDNVLQTVEMIKNITGIGLLDILKEHMNREVLKGETAEWKFREHEGPDPIGSGSSPRGSTGRGSGDSVPDLGGPDGTGAAPRDIGGNRAVNSAGSLGVSQVY